MPEYRKFPDGSPDPHGVIVEQARALKQGEAFMVTHVTYLGDEGFGLTRTEVHQGTPFGHAMWVITSAVEEALALTAIMTDPPEETCQCGMWPIEEFGRRCPSCWRRDPWFVLLSHQGGEQNGGVGSRLR